MIHLATRLGTRVFLLSERGEQRDDAVMMSGQFVLGHADFWADLRPAVAPNNPPAPPATPPQQQGNSWSHPFTPPTCSQIGHGAAADLAISFAATGGGKTPPNPVSALLGWTGMAEATFYGLFCQ